MSPNERTREKAHYAHKRRVDLLRVLAKPGPELETGECDECGIVLPLAELTIDHAAFAGAGWDHDGVNQSRRVARYWREYRAGVALRALCTPCNSAGGSDVRAYRRRTA